MDPREVNPPSARFCIQACSVRRLPAWLLNFTVARLDLPLSHPTTHPPNHPVPLLKEKKSSCPGSWKLNQSTSLRSNVSQSRRCNSIIYNEAVFRFVSLDPQPSLSLTPSPSLFHSPFYIPVSLFILYTLSQFSVGSYRVRSSQVSMLSSLFCCRRPQSLAICIYFYECVFVGVRV